MSKHPKPGADKPHPRPHQASAAEDKCDITGSVHVRGEIVVNPPPDIAKKQDAESEKKDARDRLRLRMEIVGLIFVILYAGLTGFLVVFTHGQLKEARKVTQATNENFRVDQRPWVAVKSIDLGILKENGSPILTTLTMITNTGRSPAFDIEITDSGFQTNYGALDLDGWIKSGKLKGNLVPMSAVLASNDTAPIPADHVPITDEQVAQIQNHILWLYVFGDIHYVDAFGVSHLTRYCGIYNPPTKRFDVCRTHEYIDRNK